MMMMPSRAVRRRALWGASPWVVAAALTLAASGAAAQVGSGAGTPGSPAADGDAEPAEVEEVVVTGSFIRGTPEDAALPVDVIGAEELAQQGSPTIVQLVKNLPAAQSSIGESNRFLGTAAGSATVNLRGFGSSRTLVLFNGRRMAASPANVSGDSIDINFIPAAAIGRVEVLRDGAAATYGSEAIGGVVNFISRSDLDGLEITGQYAFIDGSEGDYDLNAAYGWRSDRADVLLTAGYRRRSELQTIDRDWAIQPFAANNFGGWSTASNPGVFQTGTAAQLAAGTFGTSFRDNGCAEVGGTLVEPTTAATGCRFQFSLHDNLVNDEYHYQLYGEANFEFSDDLEFHAEAFWSRHDVPNERVSAGQSTVQFPTPIRASGASPGGGTSPYPATGQNQQSRYYIPPTNPGLIAFLNRSCPTLGAAICGPDGARTNGVITSQTLWRPNGYGGNPVYGEADEQQRAAEAFRVAGGFNGELPLGINFDVGVTYMKADGFERTPDTSVTRFQLAMNGLGGPGCNPVTGTPGVGPCSYYNPFSNAYPSNATTGAVNPFYVSGLDNSRELFEWMRGDQLQRFTQTQILTLDAVFTGDTPFTLPGGVIQYAVGGQYRYDSLEVRRNDQSDFIATPCVDSPPFGDGIPVCVNGAGPFAFYGNEREIAVDRIVNSVFAETRVPILDNLEFSAAIRYESFGGNVGSTTNPRVSLRYEPLDWLTLRATAGSTFRAPPQPSITPGFNRVLSNFIVGGQSLYRPADVSNNPNLRPETADTYNLGVLFDFGGFRASLDYYNFAFKDELTSETPAAVINTLFPTGAPNRCGVAALRSRFNFADDGNPLTDDCAPGNLLGVRTNLINGPGVDTSGVDFAVSYIFEDLFAGDLTIGVDGSYLKEYERGALITIDGFEIAPALDRAGKSELLSQFYSYPKWKANGYLNFNRDIHNVRYITRYKQGTDNLVGATVLATEDTIEHDITYTVELPYEAVLTLSVQNIFDTDPEFTRSQYNYDYTQTNPLGRVFEIGFKKLF